MRPLGQDHVIVTNLCFCTDILSGREAAMDFLAARYAIEVSQCKLRMYGWPGDLPKWTFRSTLGEPLHPYILSLHWGTSIAYRAAQVMKKNCAVAQFGGSF